MSTWRSVSRGTSPGARPSVQRFELVALVGLVAFGAAIRATGFTHYDLWFDDAWSAAAARTGFGQSLHMLLTAPGYSMAQRLWIMIAPTTTWWAQLPDFIAGLGTIPAVWALARWLKFSRAASLFAALFMTVTPTAVDYSTRVKEYQVDLLVACLLLVLGERIRRNPRTASYWPLAAATVVAFFISASTAVVVAGVWLMTLLLVIRDRERWPRWLIAAAATGLGCGLVWLGLLRQLPAVLNVNWKNRGYLVDYSSSFYLRRSIRMIFGGFAHSTLAFPVPQNFYRGGTHGGSWPAIIVGAVVLGLAILIPLVQAWRHRRVTVGVSAALTLAVALLLAATDRVPLGDGRTDLVLYPALVVSAVIGVGWIARRFVPWLRRLSRAVPVVLALVIVVGAGFVGVEHTAAYPTLDLRGLAQRIDAVKQPGDVIVVDTFNSFAWCYYKLSPCHFQLGLKPEWPQEFQPVSTSSKVVIPLSYRGPYPGLSRDLAHARRVWYVGFYYGTFDAGSPELAPYQVQTGVLQTLYDLGWHRPTSPATATFLKTVNVYSFLLVR